MILKLILTFALSGVALYAWTQSAVSRLVRGSLYGVITAGIYFVWHPDQATEVANAFGIGRGADLIVYLWIVLSFAVVLNIHLKLRQSHIMLTQLARQLAMSHPYYRPDELNSTMPVSDSPGQSLDQSR